MTRSRIIRLEAAPVASDGQSYVFTDYDGNQHRISVAGTAGDAAFIREIARQIAAIADSIEKQAP